MRFSCWFPFETTQKRVLSKKDTHFWPRSPRSLARIPLQILRDHEARKDPEMLWGDEQDRTVRVARVDFVGTQVRI